MGIFHNKFCYISILKMSNIYQLKWSKLVLQKTLIQKIIE